jgi:hypothetical protein
MQLRVLPRRSGARNTRQIGMQLLRWSRVEREHNAGADGSMS